MANLRRVLWYLLGGTRGGPLRVRIVRLLRERPHNTNQIATALGIDYKTAQHHMRVLLENRVVTRTGHAYGALFFVSPDMEESWDEFDAIARRLAPRPPREPPHE